MVRLSPEQFVNELSKCFTASQISGKTVFISQKRCAPKTGSSEPPKCLFRVIHGTKKISTLVDSNEAAKFHAMYLTAVKVGTTGLRRAKKDKKKKDKDSSTPITA